MWECEKSLRNLEAINEMVEDEYGTRDYGRALVLTNDPCHV